MVWLFPSFWPQSSTPVHQERPKFLSGPRAQISTGPDQVYPRATARPSVFHQERGLRA